MSKRLKILLVVDIQKQFKDNNGNYEKIIDYINNSSSEYDRVIATYFKSKDTNNFFDMKLGWHECKNTSSQDIEFSVPNISIYEKPTYAFKEIDFIDFEDAEVYIIGCDSDACVLATCFYFWDKKIDFKVLTEYIYTNSKLFSNEDVISLMRRNFGKCIC